MKAMPRTSAGCGPALMSPAFFTPGGSICVTSLVINCLAPMPMRVREHLHLLSGVVFRAPVEMMKVLVRRAPARIMGSTV